MLAINGLHRAIAANAGGRLWTNPEGQELWGKPLAAPADGLALALFNRAGTVIGVVPDGSSPLPPHCSDPNSTLGPCMGCFGDYDKLQLSPCDDNVTASSGAQTIVVGLVGHFDALPPRWIGLERPQQRIMCLASGIPSHN